MVVLLRPSSRLDVLVGEVPLSAGGAVLVGTHCVQCPSLVLSRQPVLDGSRLLG